MKKLYSVIFMVIFCLGMSNTFPAQESYETLQLPYELARNNFTAERLTELKVKEALGLLRKGNPSIVTKSDIKNAYAQLMSDPSLIDHFDQIAQINKSYQYLQEVFDLKRADDTEKILVIYQIEEVPVTYQIEFFPDVSASAAACAAANTQSQGVLSTFDVENNQTTSDFSSLKIDLDAMCSFTQEASDFVIDCLKKDFLRTLGFKDGEVVVAGDIIGRFNIIEKDYESGNISQDLYYRCYYAFKFLTVFFQFGRFPASYTLRK